MADDTQKPGNTPLDNLNRATPLPLSETNSIRQLKDLIEVVDAAPTGFPKKFWDSVKIFDDSGTYYLYVYAQGIGWISTTLT